MRQTGYYEAYLDDFDKIVVFLSHNCYEGQSNKFYLKDNHGHTHDLHIQSIEKLNNYNKYSLVLFDELEIGNEYYVVHQHARATILNYSAIVKTDRFDDMFYYDGDDLGYTYNETFTSFALWAPTAYRVKLEVMKNDEVNTYEMKRDAHGVFRYKVLQNLENATYVFQVRVNGKWMETTDPYGVSSIENSKRSAVVDLNKIKVHDYPLPLMHSPCDAIIYETSVRDFTMQTNVGIQNRGTFTGFVEHNEQTKIMKTGFSYLKTLGITHVQLMPVMDFGSVDEIFPLLHYNWGYDPVHYRVLEGSYSSDPTNPYSRMFEFVKLIEECHKIGIRVNLDVVFNHVYDKDDCYFEKTVPDYYFQMNAQGDFSNGTYCGNDVDSTRKMCSKYIVDACKFLVNTYHIDGLRFDLMGILDIDTMNKVYEECAKINPDFMVYGEGWDMPSFLDFRKRASMRNNAKMPHIAHFSDRFRDVVKGRTATNEVNVKGYCTGALYLVSNMENCLSASCANVGDTKMLESPVNVVNYVECHDNMTSWDKLKECCKEDNKEVRIAKHKMMIASVLLAQGIPFLHSGQEFARSKHSLPNTYEESDEINKLDYLRRNQYMDIVECTKELIKVRKAHPCLRYATTQEVENNISYQVIDNKALIYHMNDANEEMIVIFNPTGEYFNYHVNNGMQLLYYNGKVEDIKIQSVNIEPYSVIILGNEKTSEDH